MIADNDPEEQEKMIKFNTLLTNVVIFHTTLDIRGGAALIDEGWKITAEDLASCRHT